MSEINQTFVNALEQWVIDMADLGGDLAYKVGEKAATVQEEEIHESNQNKMATIIDFKLAYQQSGNSVLKIKEEFLKNNKSYKNLPDRAKKAVLSKLNLLIKGNFQANDRGNSGNHRG